MSVYVEDTEVFVSESGTLFVKDKGSDNCFALTPKDFIGDIKKQGACISIGKFDMEWG